MEAVKQYGDAIQYIPQEFRTEQMMNVIKQKVDY
jgi:hypothetical protein